MTIEGIQQICRQYPGVTEDIKWGNDLVFSVGGKMFCVLGIEQSPVSASFKARDENFDEMSHWPGFKPAPYLAKNKWVWTGDINNLKKADWELYIRRSYELVSAKLTKKLRKELGLE